MRRIDQDQNCCAKRWIGEEVSDFRKESLASGLAAVRRRRRYQRAAQAGAIMVS